MVQISNTYVSASPKLGAIYRFTDNYRPISVATSCRAPPYDERTRLRQRVVLSDPADANLKPETANSFESAARPVRERSSWQLTGFYNLYNHFLEPPRSATSPSHADPYVNLSNVTIWGVEARGSIASRRNRHAGWTACAQGTDQRTGCPSIGQPVGEQARVRYGSDKGIVAQLIGTVTAQHTLVSSRPTPGASLLQSQRHPRLRLQRATQDQRRRVQHHNAKYWNRPT